jgi:DNA phosphorothioation-dependent restriction protein DptG
LTCAAKLFYNECPKPHAGDVKWKEFKYAFSERFRDYIQTNSTSFNYRQLGKYTDSCRGLAERVMCNVNDPVAQRIHRENTDRIVLANFVAGLTGVTGKQVL